VFTDVGPNVFRMLYRSVSPWEMADILATQQIRGRGGRFADDSRAGPDCHVWFAESIRPIIHSGEEYLRYMQGLSMWDPVHNALNQLWAIYNAAYDKLEAERQANIWPPDRETSRIYHGVRELHRKLGDAYRKGIYGLAKQANASAAKLPVTSYVIHLYDMPGGTMYSDRDSMQRDALEVCFPLSAASSLYAHIAGVDLIKRIPGGGYETVGHVTGEELSRLKVRLPSVQKRTADAVLNTYERMRPKLERWIDV
jgi:hypothetical protein